MRILLFIAFAGGIGIAVGALRMQYQRASELARDREEALTGLRTSELTYRALAEVSAATQAVWTWTDGRVTWSDHAYTDDELQQLVRRVPREGETYVMFNNIPRVADSRRFIRVAAQLD